ncbi:corticotropin-releasing factor receptor 1-like isoform X2 [Ptychodera flava]|uniref:corticotropin-releasing factor receptor 1-like isoform X2 n=1 Tax=Ptychodera flava TaxID=63121 RepID=UPI00396A44F1
MKRTSVGSLVESFHVILLLTITVGDMVSANQTESITMADMACDDFEQSYNFTGPHCNRHFDRGICWPDSPANTTVYVNCPAAPGHSNEFFQAYRLCTSSGEWYTFNLSYTMCLWLETFGAQSTASPTVEPINHAAHNVNVAASLIYIIGNSVGIIFLSIALFIFCYLKCLSSTRISIHKNLIASFILKAITQILHLHPFMFAYTGLPKSWTGKTPESLYFVQPEYCRPVLAFYYYSSFANLAWMFVEGLFLLSRITISVFSKDPNFIVFYIIGWVCPIPFTLTWALVLLYNDDAECWSTQDNWKYFWILHGPMTAYLLANFVFLIAIVFILVTKLRASNEEETAQVRKATKATAVLLPLLGLTNLLFFFDPGTDIGEMKTAVYNVVQAIFSSTQGILVAILYCFLNNEVRFTIRRKLTRYRRDRNQRDRRRFSKTSTYLMTSSTEKTEGKAEFVAIKVIGQDTEGHL